MTLQFYALASAAPLLSIAAAPHEVTSSVVVLTGNPFGNQISYWHPIVPKQICTIDFRDWIPMKRWSDVVVAKRGDELLFWHLALGCGVRTLMMTKLDALRSALHYVQGTFFVQVISGSTLTITAVPMLAEAVPPAANRSVPADVSFVGARTVYTGVDLAPMAAVATHSMVGTEGPLFARSLHSELWGL